MKHPIVCALLTAGLSIAATTASHAAVPRLDVAVPVGAFITGSSLGKRRGFCPLYPLMCGVGILMFIPMARLVIVLVSTFSKTGHIEHPSQFILASLSA